MKDEKGMKTKTVIRVEKSIQRQAISLFVSKGKALAVDLVFREHDPDCCLAWEPTMNIQETEAQVLMDDLWAAGLRPTEGSGSAGAIAAVKFHLEDMRKLVFKGK